MEATRISILITLGIMGGLAALFVLVLGWPDSAYPTYVHRYRLTVEVKVDDKIHRGSSVIQSSALAKPRQGIEQSPGGRIKVRGDAVFIDIGGGKNLFATLTHGKTGTEGGLMSRLAIKLFDVPECKGAYCDWREIANMTGKRELPNTYMPTLVTFTDVKDPRTAEVVYATQPERRSRGRLRKIVVDRFDEVFGGKVRLHKAWIELTKDPITRGIEKKLPWLITHADERNKFRARRMTDPFYARPGHFKIGD